jgi:hypothetical protein
MSGRRQARARADATASGPHPLTHSKNGATMFLLIRYIRRAIRYVRIQLLVMFALAVRRDRWLLRWLNSEQAEIDRSRYGIHSFIGENGSGKTNVMVRQALRQLARGRTVISNVPLFIDKAAGELHPNFVPFTRWADLKDVSRCCLVFDEVTAFANARENAPLPPQMQVIFNQLRKRKITVLWASPSWEDATAQLRRVTRAVTFCEGFWSDKAAYKAASAVGDAEFDEAWIPNRLFHARTFRKSTTAEFSLKDAGQPEVDEWYWGPGSPSFAAYDTNEETSRLQEADEVGVCMECGGGRRRDECSCADYREKKARRKLVGAHA